MLDGCPPTLNQRSSIGLTPLSVDVHVTTVVLRAQHTVTIRSIQLCMCVCCLGLTHHTDPTQEVKLLTGRKLPPLLSRPNYTAKGISHDHSKPLTHRRAQDPDQNQGHSGPL